MKALIALAGVGMLIASNVGAVTNTASFVVVKSSDYGDTNCLMQVVEIERNASTSKLRLTCKKMGSSVGSSMFIMSAFYEVAKARGMEYFINLKEWEDSDGGRLYVAGFTNTKDVDIHKEFGVEYTLTNECGQTRDSMSVSECRILFERRSNE